MSQTEFLAWQAFYVEEPFDDHHRYHRPAILVASAMAGGRYKDKIDFLVPPVTEPIEGFSDVDMKTFIALGGTPPTRR